MAIDKAIDSAQLDADLTDVADAIRTKGGTSDALEFPGGFVDAVGAIQTGSGEAKEEAPLKDVNFYDYDGTRLYSYTTAEAAALTELPPLPVVDGLTYTGWSWTLEEVTSLNADDPWAEIVAFCHATDGYWAHITLGTEEDCKNFTIACYPTAINDLRIDWGDGTVETPEYDKAYQPASSRFSHDYASPGKYSIHVTPITKSVNVLAIVSARCASLVDALWMGEDWNGNNYLWSNIYTNNYVRAITLPGKDIDYGSNLGVKNAVLWTGKTLKIFCSTEPNTHRIIATPKTVSFAKMNGIYGQVNAVGSYRIPDGVTGEIAGTNMFNAQRLKHVRIPEGSTKIGYRAFYQARALEEVTIPSTITTVSSDAFNGNFGMKRYIIKASTPPTLDNKSAFNQIPDDCVFYVPDESITAYQEATNWSTWADRYHGLSELEGRA